jgi:hypothetical protein
MRNAYKILVGNLKRPLGRPRDRWDDNIRMDLKEKEWEGVDWDAFGSEYGPVVGSYEHGNELSGSIKAGNFLTS